MAFELRKKILGFIGSEKEYPVLAGFVIGFYLMAFYYSHNLELFSWQQFLFFIGYYVVFPTFVITAAWYFLKKGRFKKYVRQVIFVLAAAFFTFFVLQNLILKHSYVKIFFLALFLIVLISFKFNNYKAGFVLIFFMAFFPMAAIGNQIYTNFQNSPEWNKQPDAILNAKFIQKPNVYYLQVDGYASVSAFKNKYYHFDNSAFEHKLSEKGFTLYEDFRSNYKSTLMSNASCFNMKHHYSRQNAGFKTARDYIVGENPVLEIFKSNGYKTFFITERPYLIMNRPDVKYDYANFTQAELPYFKDGWDSFKEIAPELKRQILKNKQTRNFMFVEKLTPSHIEWNENNSKGVEEERNAYLKRVRETNVWLDDVLSFIISNEPTAIIILGADHGGIVGYSSTSKTYANITDPQQLQSIFGAQMAIRWNSAKASEYGSHLKTSVNLFRVLFSHMSGDKKYLNSLQPDISYNNSTISDEQKIYKAIE
ncbi:hypothetical protein FNO01nite_13840 [Flavobacterium noncentrifugens]|uniref:Sulfatase N-terminal domain-containing protein n=1 Tax=Flavobacterium noncentrifugens TaxID=1128970 RepID=A0A1G8W0H4_9FLAO|nr:sulfatase-like hydrolase/transferase [Flavobacterium noncentrifugens]GEP50712.1 hypothetical protein FNO01nite_13840 [Flavobacterium noncentrifugens]SDJ71553.1 hypothetical protein SAMN04487935_1587 [Flavobacterium noncentrifugens]